MISISNLFSAPTYSFDLSLIIVSNLEGNDLSNLSFVNKFCQNLCDRVFKQRALNNAYRGKGIRRPILSYFPLPYYRRAK